MDVTSFSLITNNLLFCIVDKPYSQAQTCGFIVGNSMINLIIQTHLLHI